MTDHAEDPEHVISGYLTSEPEGKWCIRVNPYAERLQRLGADALPVLERVLSDHRTMSISSRSIPMGLNVTGLLFAYFRLALIVGSRGAHPLFRDLPQPWRSEGARALLAALQDAAVRAVSRELFAEWRALAETERWDRAVRAVDRRVGEGSLALI